MLTSCNQIYGGNIFYFINVSATVLLLCDFINGSWYHLISTIPRSASIIETVYPWHSYNSGLWYH